MNHPTLDERVHFFGRKEPLILGLMPTVLNGLFDITNPQDERVCVIA